MMIGYRMRPSRWALFAVFFMAAIAGFHGVAAAKQSSAAAGVGRVVLLDCQTLEVGAPLTQILVTDIEESLHEHGSPLLDSHGICADTLANGLSAGLKISSVVQSLDQILEITLAADAPVAQPADAVILFLWRRRA
jgi:hypothetical protein